MGQDRDHQKNVGIKKVTNELIYKTETQTQKTNSQIQKNL